MKGSGVSQKHTAVGQRGEQIAFKAVCFTDGSERRGVEEQEEKGGGKIVLDVFFLLPFNNKQDDFSLQIDDFVIASSTKKN